MSGELLVVGGVEEGRTAVVRRVDFLGPRARSLVGYCATRQYSTLVETSQCGTDVAQGSCLLAAICRG